jgi:hypothetical protein
VFDILRGPPPQGLTEILTAIIVRVENAAPGMVEGEHDDDEERLEAVHTDLESSPVCSAIPPGHTL